MAVLPALIFDMISFLHICNIFLHRQVFFRNMSIPYSLPTPLPHPSPHALWNKLVLHYFLSSHVQYIPPLAIFFRNILIPYSPLPLPLYPSPHALWNKLVLQKNPLAFTECGRKRLHQIISPGFSKLTRHQEPPTDREKSHIKLPIKTENPYSSKESARAARSLRCPIAESTSARRKIPYNFSLIPVVTNVSRGIT